MPDIPKIQDSYDKSVESLSVSERYYSPRYRVDFDRPGEDICVLFHSNRICVVTLALSHLVLTGGKVVEKVDFRVSPNIDRLDNTVSGKGKRGAQILSPTSTLCIIKCTDGSEYPVRSCVPGKLVEVNEQLIDNPQLVMESPSDRGYLAIVLPTVKASEAYKKEMLTKEQYEEGIGKRCKWGLDVS